MSVSSGQFFVGVSEFGSLQVIMHMVQHEIVKQQMANRSALRLAPHGTFEKVRRSISACEKPLTLSCDQKVRSDEIQAGDIVKVERGEFFPGTVLVLCVSSFKCLYNLPLCQSSVCPTSH